MAEELKRNPEKKIKNVQESSNINNINNVNNDGGEKRFKFNVEAPEFIPRSYSLNSSFDYNNNKNNQMGLSTGYFYPCVQYLQDGGGDPLLRTKSADWFYVNQPLSSSSSSITNNNNNNNNNNNIMTTNNNHDHNYNHHRNGNNNNIKDINAVHTRNSFADDLKQNIIKQVEYLFSDLSLMANDTMAKNVSKDPEGYVPIPVIASMKKIKALVTDHHLLVQAIRSSTKLVVNKDNKKVKRKSPFTENYKDELQCRTVMVENLPDDHSYQNLEKIFSVVGSVKAIRLCHPPEANPSRAKSEVVTSNKLHALVEYENSEIAEKAAEKLNDERTWRKGMRVRVMLRRSPKSVLMSKKSDFDMFTADEEPIYCDSPKETSPHSDGPESIADNNGEESPSSSRKASGRGRVKTKGRAQNHNDRGLFSSPTHSIGALQCDTSLTKNIINKGPRMPDGTRGFTMGRGKPISTPSTPSAPTG